MFYILAILGFYLSYMIASHLLKYGLITYALGTEFYNFWLIIPLCLSLFWSCLGVFLGLMKAEVVRIN